MGKNKNRGGSSAAKTETAKAIGVALFVIVIAVAYVITSLALGIRAGAPVWNPLKWGKAGATQTQPGGDGGDDNPVIAVDSDGSAIKNGCTYSMGRNAISGITYLTETQNNQTYVPEGEIYVTAELSNEYINGAFDWSVKFANENAEWAVGKVADYYVAADAVPGDSSRAKLRFLAPFAEQIILTATLRGTDSSDSCTIDCVKPVTLSSWEYYGDTGDGVMEVSATVNYGVGTVTGDFVSCSATIDFTDQFTYDFKDYLKFDVGIRTISLNNPDSVTTDSYSNGGTLAFAVYAIFENELTHSMFIENFDNYDKAHKEAIYYAWYNAAKDTRSNFYLTATFSYGYSDVVISYEKCDYQLLNYRITGEYYDGGNGYAPDLAPNVQLNKNYVF